MIEFLLAKLKQEKEQELYKTYISECLRHINTSIAKRLNGTYFKNTYAETKRASFKPPRKQRPAKDIIAEVNNKAGLVVRD